MVAQNVIDYSKKLLSQVCKDYNLNEDEVFAKYFQEIELKDIETFEISGKHDNDKNNKMREKIIQKILEKKIPESFFEQSSEWKKINDAVWNYVKTLVPNEYISTVKIEPKGGRKFNHDFNIIVNNKLFKIELKFNAENIDKAPQFVSPMKPDQYMNHSYQEYFYDNYLPKLCEFSEFSIPDKSEYLNTIHQSYPKCMKNFQELYYQGCKGSSQYTADEKAIQFYKLSLELSKESRKKFLENTDLIDSKLSHYLKESQKNKIYMLYKNGMFFKEEIIDVDEYEIKHWKRNPEKYRFEAVTKANKNIEILLRWKNGEGIAFPAFQIKRV